MKDGGRLNAGIEILTQVYERHRPFQDTLKDWSISNRYAGSTDRNFIRNLVLDALRCKQSVAWQMKSEDPRAIVLGTYAITWQQGFDKLNSEIAEDKFGPDKLSKDEIDAVSNTDLETAPDHIKADVPEWLWPSISENFGDEALDEGKSLAGRPPMDLRVNTLKSNREKIMKRLAPLDVVPTPISPMGIRVRSESGPKRYPRVTSEPEYQKGWIELQDESSQIATILVNAKPGGHVLDYCAGAGGKTLALSAEMENKGQIYAYDSDKTRLSPIHQRLVRSGARNVQVRTPGGEVLTDLVERMDNVLVDAPCSGSGVWRRRPDAKWRITEEALANRIAEQQDALNNASKYVKVGGCLVYATCSVLPEENENQIYTFAEENPEFEIVSLGEVWQDRFGFDAPKPWSTDMKSITMTPASTGTDGFYLAVMIRNPK